MYESQKPLVGHWPSSAWGQRELTATGWQLNDIRRMTTECPQKTLSICTCPDSLAMTFARRNGTIMDWPHMQTNTEGLFHRGLYNGVARWFGCIKDTCTVRDDLLEVRSTGYLSGKHQSSAEEVVSTVTSVRGARYDVGSVRFSNKSALSGPCPVPTV